MLCQICSLISCCIKHSYPVLPSHIDLEDTHLPGPRMYFAKFLHPELTLKSLLVVLSFKSVDEILQLYLKLLLLFFPVQFLLALKLKHVNQILGKRWNLT